MNDINNVAIEGEILSIQDVNDVKEKCAELAIWTREGGAGYQFHVVITGADAEKVLNKGEPGQFIAVSGALRPYYISARHVQFPSKPRVAR